MNISICVPTLNRYALLNELIASLQGGTLLPDDLWIIDNGGGYFSSVSADFMDSYGIRHHYRKFGENIGCAKSWNRFIEWTTDLRIISNDDILFREDTLQRMVDAFDPNALTCPENIVGGNSFSCFCLPDRIVQNTGLFDEALSPNFAYFEDVDMSRRLRLAGFEIRGVPGCLVEHAGSATLKAYSEAEMQEHHRKFQIAQQNYVKKWNGLPGEEKWLTPHGANG